MCIRDRLKVAFFKQPWLAREFARGDRLALIGKMEFAYGFKQMASPHFEDVYKRQPLRAEAISSCFG